MTRSSFREPDYACGRRMLTLRTAIGLTQAALADLLRVSRHAVGAWETGESYPKTDHLKHVIALGLREHAFAAGCEAEEIRALWRAAHQKVLVDEAWLHALLREHVPTAPSIPFAEWAGAPHAAGGGPRVAWGDALDVPSFYGREAELGLLERWVLEEHCRVVSVLGLGGIGKSALTVTFMHQAAPRFDVVIWRSLRDVPACDAVVAECLQVLTLHQRRDLPDGLDARLRLLMEQLREQRVLLVLDNLEMVLEEGAETGRMRSGCEGYARLLRQAGATAHRSCLLLTSREKPAELVPLEGSRLPVRTMHLTGLDPDAGARLLMEEDVGGSALDRARLVETYGGNPLAIKIVVQTVVDLFGGEVAPFLEQGELVFGGVRELVREHVERLSALEQEVFFWLAILREPVQLEDLLAVMHERRATGRVLEALDGLLRRSVIEQGRGGRSFTLQSVVLEYATARLIEEASSEIERGRLDRLIRHGLCLAQVKEYVRQAQERLLVAPLLSQLHRTYQAQAIVEEQALRLLAHLRGWADQSQGYGPANLVTLLRVLRGNLRALDLTGLALRGVSLQGVEMQDTTLAAALLRDSAFTETFDAITAVAISSPGTYWAAASRDGYIRTWHAGGHTLHRAWRAHDSLLYALAFSPDGSRLASGSWDCTLRVWDVPTGDLLWSGRHAGNVNSVVFAADGSIVASGGDDGVVRLWDAQHGLELHALPHGETVSTMAWSPDGRLLAAGDLAGCVQVWAAPANEAPTHVRTLVAHAEWVDGLTFSPDSGTLASASKDGTVKLWSIRDERPPRTLTGHTNRVTRVAWSPDGRIVASGSFDRTILLWDVEHGSYRTALHGHTAVIVGIAFTPDSRALLSGGEDGTLRVWDSASGQCMRLLQGYATSLYAVDWSPRGTHLIGGGSDTLVTIFDVAGRSTPRVFKGHRGVVYGVGWNADGRWVASSELDNVIRLWDPALGECRQVLTYPDDPGNFFYGLAWSPDGQRLAAGTFRRGVQVFDLAAPGRRRVEHEFPTWIRPVAWAPHGALVAGGGDDGTVYVWDAEGDAPVRQLKGHYGKVTSVAWSPDGARLASGAGGSDGGELFVWDPARGERVACLEGHPERVLAVAWDSRGEALVSGGSDGSLRWWDVGRRDCVRVQAAHEGAVQALRRGPDGTMLASSGDDGAIMLWDLHTGAHLRTLRRDRPYERLNITGIRGLTEAQKTTLVALGAVEGPGDGAHTGADGSGVRSDAHQVDVPDIGPVGTGPA